MSRKLIFFLCFLIISGCNSSNDEATTPAEKTAEQSTLLNEPGRAATLASQASQHIQNQRYQEALTDIDAVLALVPNHTEYRFLQCMLQERAGEDPSAAKSCYTKVVEQLSENKPCETDINCVVADLMAEGPEAEVRRQRFLALPATTAESEIHHFVIDEFNREKYLETILPRHSLIDLEMR